MGKITGEENGVQKSSLYVHAPLSMEGCEGNKPKIPILSIILRKSGRMSLHREQVLPVLASPSTLWIPGIGHRSSGMAAGPLPPEPSCQILPFFLLPTQTKCPVYCCPRWMFVPSHHQDIRIKLSMWFMTITPALSRG